MKNGIILVDKEAGITSRRVDNLIQRRFLTKKVGHLGTLDPFATGLLVVAIGKGTKYLQYLDDSRKTYVAELTLGKKTSTGDVDGEIVAEAAVPELSPKDAAGVLASFLGKGAQLPPMTSAIKIDGVPLYKKAHKGEEVERKPRDIEIFSIKLLNVEGERISFVATVSKGTYIRVLGEDIAERLGTLGFLSSLRRVEVGPFSVVDSKKIDVLGEEDVIDPAQYLGLRLVEIDDKALMDAYNGRPIVLPDVNEGMVLLVRDGASVAIYRKEGGRYVSERGLF